MKNEDNSFGGILNPYSATASIDIGGSMMIDPSKVVDNLIEAIERIGLDPDSPAAISDAASEDELLAIASVSFLSAVVAGEFARRAWQVMLDHNAAAARVFMAKRTLPSHPALGFAEDKDLMQGYEFFRAHLIEVEDVAQFADPGQFVNAVIAIYYVAATFVAGAPRAPRRP